MKCFYKTISLLALLLGSMAPLSMAQSAELPAESVQLIQNSTNLELEDIVELAHELALLSPECADQILAQILATRTSWSDLELASVFSAIVSSLPETLNDLHQDPDAVQQAVETGQVDASLFSNSMSIALLNVIATSPSISDEQRLRAGYTVAHSVDHAGDTAAIKRLANGELMDGSSDEHDEHVQAKENLRSHAQVLEEFEEAQDDSDPGDTTSDN